MPNAQARLLLAAIIACAAGASLPSAGVLVRAASAQPAEFLPSFHALYEDLEALVARGLLPSYPIHTRPLVRADIARALLEARDRDRAIESDLHYQRLAREQRFRIALTGHARGDFDEKRAIHWRLRDESSVAEPPVDRALLVEISA